MAARSLSMAARSLSMEVRPPDMADWALSRGTES